MEHLFVVENDIRNSIVYGFMRGCIRIMITEEKEIREIIHKTYDKQKDYLNTVKFAFKSIKREYVNLEYAKEIFEKEKQQFDKIDKQNKIDVIHQLDKLMNLELLIVDTNTKYIIAILYMKCRIDFTPKLQTQTQIETHKIQEQCDIQKNDVYSKYQFIKIDYNII